MTAGKRPTVRGRSRRATCPECGRIIAAVADRHALLAGAGVVYLLHPHNVEPGRPCRGWRVDRDALAAESSSQQEDSPVAEHKRGTVLRDRDGDLWRVSNRGNAYRVNDAGHRLGARFYMRLHYLEERYGPLIPEPSSSRIVDVRECAGCEDDENAPHVCDRRSSNLQEDSRG